MTYLVSRVGTEDIQGRRDELGLNGHCVAALAFACAQRLLDGIDTSGCVACQLDICTELDWLGCQAASNGGHQDVEGCGRDGYLQLAKDGVRLTTFKVRERKRKNNV